MTEPTDKQEVAQNPEESGLDLDSDKPLSPVCDLSGDKTCESCQ
jgi:hypothetical protein